MRSKKIVIKKKTKVIYDACVLYPARLRGILIYQAKADLFKAHWTDDIHEEWIRNYLENRTDRSREELMELRNLMDDTVPKALVDGHHKHIEGLALPDPDDRHVLAAAIEVKAPYIVTENIKDFPAEKLGCYNIQAIKPDDFLAALIEEQTEDALRQFQRHRLSYKKNPKQAVEYLSFLRGSEISRTLALLTANLDKI